ncbi:MAG: hypothetical protein NVS3B7_19800 [Candidatus Elarobacter sp.]
MLNELVKRLGAGKADRRTAQRFRRRYTIAWQRGSELIPALGLEISERGVLFATKEAPPTRLVDVALDLDGRRVRARIAVVRSGPMTRDGVAWIVIAGDYQGIGADDWDAVVRFCKQQPEPGNKAAEELSALARLDDDAYRLLPLRVQERVVAALVGAGRLAPASDAKNPLLRMTYEGATRGTHRLVVHSRRNDDGDVLHFDSVLTVDDSGNVRLER